MAIDDDVFAQVRQVSQAQGVSLGTVMSELIRRALAPASITTQDGLPVFDLPAHSPTLTSEAVAAALEDE